MLKKVIFLHLSEGPDYWHITERIERVVNKAQAHGESWTHDLWIKTHVPYHIGIAAMQANLRIYVEAIR